jgi:hypothetical protein
MMSVSWILTRTHRVGAFFMAHWRHPAVVGTVPLELISHHFPRIAAAYIDVLCPCLILSLESKVQTWSSSERGPPTVYLLGYRANQVFTTALSTEHKIGYFSCHRWFIRHHWIRYMWFLFQERFVEVIVVDN